MKKYVVRFGGAVMDDITELEKKESYWCICEPHFEMPTETRCSRCHKILKNEKFTKIEMIKDMFKDVGFAWMDGYGNSEKQHFDMCDALIRKGWRKHHD